FSFACQGRRFPGPRSFSPPGVPSLMVRRRLGRLFSREQDTRATKRRNRRYLPPCPLPPCFPGCPRGFVGFLVSSPARAFLFPGAGRWRAGLTGVAGLLHASADDV